MQFINYRYRDFINQSFQEELHKENKNTVDFTGARLTGCNFQNTNLQGANFSSTAIKNDPRKIRTESIQIMLHIIWGIPIGWLAWQLNYVVFSCGVSTPNIYAWITNPLWIAGFGAAAAVSSRWMFLTLIGLIGLLILTSIVLNPAVPIIGIIMMLAAFIATLIGIYLGYRKGAIAIGMIWIAVGVSSAISAGYSWLRHQEMHFAILFAILTLLPAILATQAFSKHFAKANAAFMTSFDGADLTDASFAGAVLEKCDFTQATLANVDWSDTTFKDCKFPKNWHKNWHQNWHKNVNQDNNQAIAPQLEYSSVLEKL